MTTPADAVQNGLVLRVSLPVSGEISAVASEMAVKLAEQLGVEKARAAAAGEAVSRLVHQVGAGSGDVAVEFHKLENELRIEARQESRVSHARVPLV
jgi:hypothetical protein